MDALTSFTSYCHLHIFQYKMFAVRCLMADLSKEHSYELLIYLVIIKLEVKWLDYLQYQIVKL